MATPSFNEILQLVNNSQLLKKDRALFNVFRQLVLANNSSATEIKGSVTNLNTQVIQSITAGSAADRAIYKPQNTLGNGLILWFETDTDLLYAFNQLTNTWVNLTGAPADATYLTTADEHTRLPNSRELLAGTGITFDDTVAHQRTINASSTGGFAHDFLFMGY